MQGCILPLFLILCSITLHVATSLGINPAIDGQCKKVVAFLALQTVTVDGQGASYLGESSSKYQQHLKVALMSMRQNCPSIRPVVVSMYPLQEATKAWIKVFGAEVMIHQLTFSEDVLKLAEEPEYAWVKGVISTYLWTEVWLTHGLFDNSRVFSSLCVIVPYMQVHLIMAKYIMVADGVRGFDSTYVIWSDLDTIWMKDFNSCSLAKPTILSVSG